MRFSYEGYDSSGAARSGDVEASDAAEARAKLQTDGIFVTRLSEGIASEPTAGSAARGGRAKLEHVARFARELSVLVSTGTPLADALAALERQEQDASWAEIIGGLRSEVEQGSSLSAAMRSRGATFDPVVRSLVEAGEESGELDTMLVRLAGVVRQQLNTRRTLVGALAYPCVLFAMSGVIVIAMLMMVVPRFAGMFESLDAPVPPTTELLVSIGGFLNSYWWAVFPGFLLCVGGGWMWSRTQKGRFAIDHAMIRAPLLGPVLKKLAAARISRVLGTLLSAHLPLVDALELLQGSVGNTQYGQMLKGARLAVTNGESLASALDRGGLLLPSFLEAVRNGEATGRLGAVLSNLAEHLDEDNKSAMSAMTKSIEPLVIGFMGVVIGFLALSMFVPLFDLTSAVGGGG